MPEEIGDRSCDRSTREPSVGQGVGAELGRRHERTDDSVIDARARGAHAVFGLFLAFATIGGAAPADAQSAAESPDVDATDATDASATTGPPELIQRYESPDIGELKLPGFWQVTDVEDGVRAIEPDHPRPVAIEIGARPLPTRIPALALANALVAELTVAAGGVEPEVTRDEPMASEKDERHYLEFEITENSVQMRYAVLVISARKKAIFAALAAPPERFEDLTPRVLLQDIVDSIQ